MSGSLHSEIIADSENVFTGKPTDFKLNNFDQQTVELSNLAHLKRRSNSIYSEQSVVSSLLSVYSAVCHFGGSMT